VWGQGKKMQAQISLQRSLIFIIGLLMTGMLYSSSVNSAPDGAALFDEHCSVCHGVDGKGGVGIPIAYPSFLNSVSNDYIRKTIRFGRPGRVMPAFPVLSDVQVDAITFYVRGWSKDKAPEFSDKPVLGDIQNGNKLYFQYCASCHGKDAKGGKGTGVTFSRKRDLTIIAPALNNTGFLASVTDRMIRYTIVNGREGTPMSSASAKGLNDQQVDDIVSYIRSFENTVKTKITKENDSAVLVVDSPYGLDETVENVKQAITDQNYTLIRTDYLEHGLVEASKENKKQVVIHFCNFDFLFEALNIDPRVGLFLPCRVTVVENKGKVQIMTINPLHLSELFNNDELDESCKEMYEVYSTLLEDASL
jgi:cytochrome c oxidase cbb3-type subunit 3